MAAQCTRCNGCGKIADTDDGEAWTYWQELPLQSAIAVIAGIVKPIPCPKCGGAGIELNADALPDLYAIALMVLDEDRTHKVPRALVDAAIAAKDKARGAE